MFPTLELFREIVDANAPRIRPDANAETAKQFAGLRDISGYQRVGITEVLSRRINDAFSSGHGTVINHCKALISELIFDSKLNGDSSEPYFEILAVMKGAIVDFCSDTEVNGNWEAAIQSAIDLVSWNGPVHSDLYKNLYRADIAYAEARGRLSRVVARRRKTRIAFHTSREEELLIAKVIEKRVMHMGGIAVAKRIFELLAPVYEPTQMRYHDVNQFYPGKEVKVRLPTGYLLNLAAKHPFPKKPIANEDADWLSLSQLAKDYAALYRVQPYSNFHAVFTDATSLISTMRRLSLHDGLFAPVQLRLTDVPRVLQGLLLGLEKTSKISKAAKADVDKTVVVLQALHAAVGDRKGPVQLPLDEITGHCSSLLSEEVDQILITKLAHEKGRANANFLLPDDVPDNGLPRENRAGANLGERPLIALRDRTFLLMDYAICAPAMIEAVLTQLRELRVDSDIGYAIESFLMDELKAHGVSTKSGKYRVDNQTYECDIVVETEKRIIFIETKKKALTRAARAGLDTALLADMTSSLVEATLQSARHEYQLRRQDSLTLANADQESLVVELKGKSIERIALTLPDYGSFQDRVILERILQNQLGIEYTSGDTAVGEKIQKVNETLRELRAVTNALHEQAGKPEHWNPFFNCWFLSVYQFLILLDNVKSADQFDEELVRTRHVSMGTQDFYFEHHYARINFGSRV